MNKLNQSINPKFVIVSTGRSGSGYAAKLFTDAGIPTGHEKRWNKYEKPGIDNFGNPGSQVQIGESSWYSLPYIEQGFDGPIFHQVRNPLNVLSSLMNKELQRIKPPLAYNYRKNNTKSWVEGDDFLNNCIRHVIEWNERSEKISEITWRVESISPAHIYYVANRIDMELDDKQVRQALRKVSKKTNKHLPGPEYSWEDLPSIPETEQLHEQARRYGYNIA